MDRTVAPIPSNDPAAAMLRGCAGACAADRDVLTICVRDGERVVALHAFAPIDVLSDHERRRLLRLAISAGASRPCEESLADALRCAAIQSAALGAAGVCALVDADVACAAERFGFHSEPMREIVFPLARTRRRWLDRAAAFEALECAQLVRFDYHALGNTAHQDAEILALEHHANFLWGTLAEDGVIFQARGCELNHPQLFAELLDALRRRHGVERARFLCSTRSMLARAARGTHARSYTQCFVYRMSDGSNDIHFDAHAGLACSRH